MKLKQWLDDRDMTATAFAKLADLDVSTVTRVINGERRPEWQTLDKILAATSGEVTPNDFVPESEPPPSAEMRAAV